MNKEEWATLIENRIRSEMRKHPTLDWVKITAHKIATTIIEIQEPKIDNIHNDMTQEFIHEFKGYGILPSSCTVRMLLDDGEALICFMGDKGVGTSVTNASEQLAQEIVNKFMLSPDECRFFETYRFGELNEIEYDWDLRTHDNKTYLEATYPRWASCNNKELIKLFSI